jgi:hypothetical protein
MTFDKRDFSNPSASSLRDEAFSSFGIGGVHQNPDNEKGGISRPSKFQRPSALRNRPS